MDWFLIYSKLFAFTFTYIYFFRNSLIYISLENVCLKINELLFAKGTLLCILILSVIGLFFFFFFLLNVCSCILCYHMLVK